MHGLPLISTLAVALALALLLGFIANRLKLPNLVGYLVAGILIGPYTPGIYADLAIAQQLAEIGVMLLMFGVGLHFSLEDLLDVKKIALPGAIVQMLVATALGASAAMFWGWNLGSALIFGISLSCASTVVLLRALEQRNAIKSTEGHIAVGWLIVEDLAMIIVLVLLPPIANLITGNGNNGEHSVWLILFFTLLKVSAFIWLMLVVGPKLLPKLLWQIAKTGSHELFILCVIAAAVSIAYGAAELFGVSFALGAFFAGMILRESSLSHRAAQESLPLRDAFAVLFFVSVGMLFNPSVLIDQPLRVFWVVTIIVFGKSLAAMFLVFAFRYSLNTALVVSASLAQIGEFSFILAELGINLGILPIEGRSYILAGALISIALNPFLFQLIKPIKILSKALFPVSSVDEKPYDLLSRMPSKKHKKNLSGHLVMIGYGHIGKRIANMLIQQYIPFIIIDTNREVIETLRKEGIPAIWGDPLEDSTLEHAHLERARMMLMLITDSVDAKQLIGVTKKLNAKIEFIIRTDNEEEAMYIKPEIKGKVFFAEEEISNSMGEYVINKYLKPYNIKA